MAHLVNRCDGIKKGSLREGCNCMTVCPLSTWMSDHVVTSGLFILKPLDPLVPDCLVAFVTCVALISNTMLVITKFS